MSKSFANDYFMNIIKDSLVYAINFTTLSTKSIFTSLDYSTVKLLVRTFILESFRSIVQS